MVGKRRAGREREVSEDETQSESEGDVIKGTEREN